MAFGRVILAHPDHRAEGLENADAPADGSEKKEDRGERGHAQTSG
jgi:hypothetical protein